MTATRVPSVPVASVYAASGTAPDGVPLTVASN